MLMSFSYNYDSKRFKNNLCEHIELLGNDFDVKWR